MKPRRPAKVLRDNGEDFILVSPEARAEDEDEGLCRALGRVETSVRTKLRVSARTIHRSKRFY